MAPGYSSVSGKHTIGIVEIGIVGRPLFADPRIDRVLFDQPSQRHIVFKLIADICPQRHCPHCLMSECADQRFNLNSAGEATLSNHGEQHQHFVALDHRCDVEGFEERSIFFERIGLFRRQCFERIDECKPTTKLFAYGTRVKAGVVRVTRGCPRTILFHERLEPCRHGIHSAGRRCQGSKNIQCFEFVHHFAAWWQCDVAVCHSLKRHAQLAQALPGAWQQCHCPLGERAMVSDVVDYLHERLFLGLAQSTAKLLQPQNLRFRWSQHQHRIHHGNVNAFVQHVNGEHDIQRARLQFFERLSARSRSWSRVNRNAPRAAFCEIPRHEGRMPGRNTERECSRLSILAPLLKGIFRSTLCSYRCFERHSVESPAPPRNVAIIHHVRNADVMERREQPAAYTLQKVAPIR